MANASDHFIREIYLFKDLGLAEAERIRGLVKTEDFSPGDEIFSEGDTAVSLYIVKYGSVSITHTAASAQTNVTTFGNGSHFGEMSFLDGEKRSATATAIEKTEVYRIDFEDLRNLLEAHPDMSVKVYKAFAVFLCGRLRMTTHDLSFAREKNLRHF